DEKGRIGGKVSVLDLAIILLVLAVALGAFLRFFVLEQTEISVEAAPVRYTLEVSGVRHWTVANIRVGDQLFAPGNVAVGTIRNIRQEPQVVISTGEDGTIWEGVLPERYVLFLEVEGVATLRDGRFLVSRTVPMGVGNSGIHFMSRYASFGATVTEIAQYGE
ncbi:MAG: DUF4330 domain-containing protein, partial [Oscillospiraceae bacterium]|nr:DUF4330 domain-containing protein [Oscillospiraceae bacterium]